MEVDRLDFIIKQIQNWKIHDPDLEDKQGFLKHLEQLSYGNYKVIKTKNWLKHYAKARSRRQSVPEYMFDRMKYLNYDNFQVYIPQRHDNVIIEVVSEKQVQELKKISKRLKRQDPSRSQK